MSNYWRMSVSNTQQKAGRKAAQFVLNKSTPGMEGHRKPHLPGAANARPARSNWPCRPGFEVLTDASVLLETPKGVNRATDRAFRQRCVRQIDAKLGKPALERDKPP